MIKVMTIHGAKGLEFKYVFLANMVDRRFPTDQRKDPIELPEELIKDIKPTGDVHLQEERRLCYVAMTRAKKELYFTSADDYGGQRKKKILSVIPIESVAKVLRTRQSASLQSEDSLFSTSFGGPRFACPGEAFWRSRVVAVFLSTSSQSPRAPVSNHPSKISQPFPSIYPVQQSTPQYQFHFQLSTLHFPLSTLHFPLSTLHFPLSTQPPFLPKPKILQFALLIKLN
jgi:ATP-dependent exoDNAse (exonuclease V) beta subunit